MTSPTDRVINKVHILSECLDDLESRLDQLLAQSLPETVANLDTIQQAKLETLIPYIVYDLILIYLKSRGIDPRTHPVFNELDRVRQYFKKIADTENPPNRTTSLDKAAATRFIKHAISQATREAHTETGDKQAFSNPDSAEQIPVKVTSKMVARAEYERQLQETVDEEEEELEVFDDSSNAIKHTEPVRDSFGPSTDLTDEQEQPGGSAERPSSASIKEGKKRKRHAVDPFSAYEGEQSVKTVRRIEDSDNLHRNLDITKTNAIEVDSVGGSSPHKVKKKKRKVKQS